MNFSIDQWPQFKTLFPYENVASTLLLIFCYIILRGVVIKTITRWSYDDPESKRKRVVALKNLFVVFLVIGFVFIWGEQLRTFALSLVAVAAAVVIATKELILCFMGGILKSSTKLFEVGDRISVDGHRGEVIDHNFLVTVLFELGPGEKSNQFSGRVLKLPNSVFLSEPVGVDRKSAKYIISTFHIPLEQDGKLKQNEEILLQISTELCEPYLQEAKKEIQDFSRREGVKSPAVEPRVLVELVDRQTVEYLVRMPVIFDKKLATEQKLIQKFFATRTFTEESRKDG